MKLNSIMNEICKGDVVNYEIDYFDELKIIIPKSSEKIESYPFDVIFDYEKTEAKSRILGYIRR